VDDHIGADLSEADLSRANLAGANLAGARNFTKVQMMDWAIINEQTLFPVSLKVFVGPEAKQKEGPSQ
jgi:hypothetical protein